MSKTAEEILQQMDEGPETTSAWSHTEAINAMREFAAQEVEAYKERLKEYIHKEYRQGYSEKMILALIESLK